MRAAGKHEKVTHIFELVKAFGATSQVEYDWTARVWQRHYTMHHDYRSSDVSHLARATRLDSILCTKDAE